MTAPALAPATSLDTGEQFDISDTRRGHREPSEDVNAWISDLARVKRADDAKAALAGYIRQASEIEWEQGSPANSLLLDRWAGLLDACRLGRPVLDANCGGYTFKPQSCDVRLCPDCERARSARLVDRYDEIGGAMATPRLWTLTLPNVAPGELRPGIGVLIDALAHLRRRAIVAGGPCRGAHRAAAFDDVDRGEHHDSGDDVEPCSHPPHRGELARVGSCRCARCLEVDVMRGGHRVTVNGCPRCTHDSVRGGVYSIEVTWSSRHGNWHPHAHLLMDAPWIAWAEVRDAWRAVTCDAIRRAERKVKNEDKARTLPRCEHHGDEKGLATDGCRGASIVWVATVNGAPGTPERRAAVRETLKYVSKGLLDHEGLLLPGAGPTELAELLLAIRGRRLVAGWGSFRNVRDDDQADDEPDTVEVYTGAFDRYEMPVVLRMPRLCPICGGEAAWQCGSALVPRTATRRLAGGARSWRPPDRRVT
jgi:hypothetical protein